MFTGVVPSHRGQRLAARLFGASLPVLRELGVRRFVLEVIRSNEAAVRAYERQGFVRRRRSSCFELSPLGPVRVLRAVERGVPLGFAAVVPKSRDLPQPVVDPCHRRRGVGTALLRSCFDCVEPDAELRVINVDESSASDLAFFTRYAVRRLPGQYEMVFPV